MCYKYIKNYRNKDREKYNALQRKRYAAGKGKQLQRVKKAYWEKRKKSPPTFRYKKNGKPTTYYIKYLKLKYFNLWYNNIYKNGSIQS